jgi:hypothetical protein
MEETENQSDGASARQTRVSFWDTLGWSVILGLILMFIAFIGPLIEKHQLAQFPGLAEKMVWSVSVCLALAYGKVVSKADPDKTALAGLGGVGVASLFVNQLQAYNPAEGLQVAGDSAAHVIDAVRVITYPLLGWTVVRLERLHLTTPAKALKWFAPLALIPGAVIWAATKDPWRGLLEVVFVTGCALVLHGKKLPAEQRKATDQLGGDQNQRDAAGGAEKHRHLAWKPEANLSTKFALLIVCLVLGAGLLIAVWLDFQSEARQQASEQARLMIQAGTAMRTYTENQIQPLIGVHRQSAFHKQWVPFYAAGQLFQYLSGSFLGYHYREWALNPTNQSDRAVGFEADIINYFRANPDKMEWSGEEPNSVTGRSWVFAHPIKAEEECRKCHGSAADAPPKLVSMYGPINGFGWRRNEIVGAQIVSVPLSGALRITDRAFYVWLSSLAGIALLTLTTVGLARRFPGEPASKPSRVAVAADEITHEWSP